MPFEDAKAAVSPSSTRRRSSSSSGSGSINRYGCFSCHEIKGFENDAADRHRAVRRGQQARLAARLRVRRRHPAHLEDRWFQTKLHDPRIFDQGRVLQPRREAADAELRLRGRGNRRGCSTAIMSFQREIQPAQAHAGEDRRAATSSTQGRNLVQRRNCVGCHIIEGDGGDYLKLVADPSLGPPMLTPEGARVQPDWLYAFLRGPITIRPWLDVRMPTFGLDDRNLNGVIQLLRRDLEQRWSRSRRTRWCARRRAPTARQGAVRAAAVPAVPRARRDSEGSADRRTWRPISAWRPSGCSRTGFSTG